jgi:ribonucleoside-diphosphate reductase alpha chain
MIREGGILLRKINDVRFGRTWSLHTPVGKLHATINEDEEGNPYETFFNVGRAGGDILSLAEGLGRLISLDLRTTQPKLATQKLKMIIEQLSGIGSSSSVGFGPQKVRSLPDAVAKILQNYINDKMGIDESQSKLPLSEPQNPPVINNNHVNICPECGNATLVYEEGCEKCICGYSKC